MFCRLLFVLLGFFFWPLCCLFFFDIRFLITTLVSSNSSCKIRQDNLPWIQGPCVCTVGGGATSHVNVNHLEFIIHIACNGNTGYQVHLESVPSISWVSVITYGATNS